MSRLTSRALDRIFGQQYLSRRAIGVSSCYGAASIATYPILLYGGPEARSALWIIPLVFLILGSLPALHDSRVTTRAVFLPAVAFVTFFLVATVQVGWLIVDDSTHDLDLFAGCASISAALIAAVASDFGWIVLVRKTFCWRTAEMPVRRIIALILVNSSALAFGLLPVFFHALFAPPWNTKPVTVFVEIFLFLLMMSRLFVTATALLFLTVLLTIFSHRLLWPLIDRTVYVVARHNLLQNRKALGTFGFTLITACAWNSPVVARLAHALGLM